MAVANLEWWSRGWELVATWQVVDGWSNSPWSGGEDGNDRPPMKGFFVGAEDEDGHERSSDTRDLVAVL